MSWALKQPGRKKYTLLFQKGSFKKKSIKVWYSKAQNMSRQSKLSQLPEYKNSARLKLSKNLRKSRIHTPWRSPESTAPVCRIGMYMHNMA